MVSFFETTKFEFELHCSPNEFILLIMLEVRRTHRGKKIQILFLLAPTNSDPLPFKIAAKTWLLRKSASPESWVSEFTAMIIGNNSLYLFPLTARNSKFKQKQKRKFLTWLSFFLFMEVTTTFFCFLFIWYFQQTMNKHSTFEPVGTSGSYGDDFFFVLEF